MKKIIVGHRSILIDIVIFIILPIILMVSGNPVLAIFSGLLLIVGTTQLLLVYTMYSIEDNSLTISNIIKTRKKIIKLSDIKSVSVTSHPEFVDIGPTPHTLELILGNGEEIYESLFSKKEAEKLKNTIQSLIQKE